MSFNFRFPRSRRFAAIGMMLIVVAAGFAWSRLSTRPRNALPTESAHRAAASRAIDALRVDFGHLRRGASDRMTLEPIVVDLTNLIFAMEEQALTDVELRRDANALVQIADFWLEASRHAEAKRALHAAHGRTVILQARGPVDPEVTLLRGRIESAMAMILRRQGEEAAARVWSRRQQTTMKSIFGGHEADLRWQQDFRARQDELAAAALSKAPPMATGETHLAELAARSLRVLATPAGSDAPAVLPTTPAAR